MVVDEKDFAHRRRDQCDQSASGAKFFVSRRSGARIARLRKQQKIAANSPLFAIGKNFPVAPGEIPVAIKASHQQYFQILMAQFNR
jgi:hypothetical protein